MSSTALCSSENIVKRRRIPLVQDDLCIIGQLFGCVDINRINELVTSLVEELLTERLTN